VLIEGVKLVEKFQDENVKCDLVCVVKREAKNLQVLKNKNPQTLFKELRVFCIGLYYL